MKTLVFILFTLMLTETTFAQTGAWKIEEGKLPDGKSYTGNLNIKAVGKTYDVDWVTSAGSYGGIGLLADGKLFVGYGVGGGDYGIVVYKASGAAKNLEGIWTTGKMNGATGTETLAKNADGNFDVLGKNADGSTYKGKLMLQKTGETFQAQWNVAGTTYNGVGFLSGDYLVIGFGFGQSFGTVEYLIMGGKARGRWAMGGGAAMGTENITR
jgi:hypothetical protein